jgi:hypothetical protein
MSEKKPEGEKSHKTGPPEKPSGPPLPQQVQAAVEAAGYPVELRVFNRLKVREMSPAFGLRMRVDETEETREIDIRAHRLTKRTSGLLALIQVKRLPEGAFVGFLGEQPSPGWIRFQRARCGGAPSYWISPAQDNSHGRIMTGDEGFGPAFDRFGEHPTCAQWCVVQRQKDRERPFFADHHTRIWEDLATLVRAKTRSGHDISNRYLRDELQENFVNLYFWFPALVVDAPLYTYDVGTQVLAPVERLTLSVSVDTFAGVVNEYVDVVTLGGLESLVDDYIATARDLEERMTDYIEKVLLAVAKRQREDLAGK